jgi:diguanylate cyclase (GGDEF)-like protein/PAS domain S-box-containing protein
MGPGSSHPASLRQLILTRVIGLVAATTVIVAACFVVFSLFPMARQIAQDHFDQSRVEVESELSSVFSPAAELLAMSQLWLAGEAPDLEAPDAFNRLFQPVLEASPQITSVVAGTSTGQGWLLLQQTDGTWRNRMTDVPRWGNRHQRIDHQPDGQSTREWREQDYDPRQRPWFQAGMAGAAAGLMGWTTPYVFFTTGDPGITASLGMPLADGRSLVIGFDLKLSDLSYSTMNAKVGQTGLALVMTDDERVLALPARPAEVDEALWRARILKPVSELSLAPVNAALAAWRTQGRSGSGVLAFDAGSQAWLASIQPYQLGGQRFWVITLAPEADFSPSWRPTLTALAVALILLLGGTAWVAKTQVRRLTRPLEALAAANDKMGQLDFQEDAPVASNVLEIRQLAQGQSAMREMLRDNQTMLAEQANELRQQNDVLNVIVNYFPGGVSMVDEQLRVTVYNAQYQQLQELPDSLFDTAELHFEDVIRHNIQRGDYGPGDPEQQLAERIALSRSGQPYLIQRQFSNGRVLEIRGLPLPGGGFVSSYVDVTERKVTEEKLRLAASVFTHTSEAITITQADGTIIDVNEAFTRITGYTREDALGQRPSLLSSGRHSQAFYTEMWRDLLEKGRWHGEIWNRHKGGEVYAEMLTINAVRGNSGVVEQYVALFSDITALKQHQAQLEHIAHYDPLTNLPNRVLLADRLHQGLAQAQRRGQLLAVAYLDLDGFKAINDAHGHDVGDQVLVALSAFMREALREGDTLARLGGDEFVAVLVDLADVAACEPMLMRLLAAAAQPVVVGEGTVQVSASLGVTFYPQMGEVDADQLLRQADQAMYQAKVAGRNRYCVFDAEEDRSVRGHHDSLDRIGRAIADGEMVLHFQPKVNLRTGEVVGMEALIRWQHPERGLLAPALFLPLIEDHPLAIDLGEWVIQAALDQMVHWQRAGLHLPVSVNIGARQLQQPNFSARLQEFLLACPAVVPGDLELEVLETSALEDVAVVSRVIETCRAIGVKFALDDFGTGYSSLTYLKRLPVTMLKIDQSFVRDMLDDPDDLAILQGVIGLASAFRRGVIAEGVETVAHGVMLLQLGCELAQGYGIARPMAAENVPAWCAAWRPDAAWLNRPAVGREGLPLLFVRAELRAWVIGVEAYLRGTRLVPPPMDVHQCQLGQWIDTGGRQRYSAHPNFQRIDAMHHELHQLSRVLVGSADRAHALDCLPALYALRDDLQRELSALMRDLEPAT